MFTKFLVIAVAVVAISSAYPQHGYGDHHVDYYAPPHYEFKYGVEDPHTGDHHSQSEHRDEDVVKGGYSLHEADGTIRKVEYVADKHNGFNAVVTRSGHAQHPSKHGHGATSYANVNLHAIASHGHH